MRGVDKDKIIIDILKEGAKTPVELRDEAIKRGVSRSTFYKHMEKLVKSGEVKKARYELIPQLVEADRQEVDDCLETLIDENNKHIILSRLEKLTRLGYNKRIAHFPHVIQKIVSLLEQDLVINNKAILSQFFECLNAILFFEQKCQVIHWKKICNRLVNATIEKAGILLLDSPNDRIISYLGRTNRKYSVEVIFQMMKKHPIEAYRGEFSSISSAFRRDGLYNKYRKLIDERLDDFLRSKDERLIKLAKSLRKEIE